MTNGAKELPLQRLTTSGLRLQKEAIVEETAIRLDAKNSLGGMYTHTTLLATPTNLIELHAGHLLAEGYISSPIHRSDFALEQSPHITVEYRQQIEIPTKERVVTSSCGACNHPDLFVDSFQKRNRNDAFRDLDLSTVQGALSSLTQKMHTFTMSGGSHGAGFFDFTNGVRHVCEDIGRHNAVDKAIGHAVFDGMEEYQSSMLLLSGRCGWDIVAKAVRTGIPAIASYGALSSAAIQLAREHGIILYGFVKEQGAWKIGI